MVWQGGLCEGMRQACLVCAGFATDVACSGTGPLYNSDGVLLHVGATIIWADGRRANFQCGFDQALTQYLEVLHRKHELCMFDGDAF